MNLTSTWTRTDSPAVTASRGCGESGTDGRTSVKHRGRHADDRDVRRPVSHPGGQVGPCPDRGERGGGALSVPMALCILAIVAVAGLTVDGVRAAQNVARADALAEEAARAAGQALDPVALAAGTPVIAPGPAADAARAYLATVGAPPEFTELNAEADAEADGETRGQRAVGGTEVTGVVTVVSPQRVRVEVTVREPALLLGLIGRDELTSTGTADAVLVPVIPGAVP